MQEQQLTRAEAAAIIRNFVAGDSGAWDWDDFLSIEIIDPEIALVRERCNAVQTEYPSHEGYCNDQGRAELLRLAEVLHPANAQNTPVESSSVNGWASYDSRLRRNQGIWITYLQRRLIIIGFCITIPFALFGAYALYWVLVLHHMFIVGW
jgi:hypothetical protein